jgi:hypothetical protein
MAIVRGTTSSQVQSARASTPSAAEWRNFIYKLIDGNSPRVMTPISARTLTGEIAERYAQEVDEEQDIVQVSTFTYERQTYTAVVDEKFGAWIVMIADKKGNLVAYETGQIDLD